jgi:hypothetical protein
MRFPGSVTVAMSEYHRTGLFWNLFMAPRRFALAWQPEGRMGPIARSLPHILPSITSTGTGAKTDIVEQPRMLTVFAN